MEPRVTEVCMIDEVDLVLHPLRRGENEHARFVISRKEEGGEALFLFGGWSNLMELVALEVEMAGIRVDIELLMTCQPVAT